MYLHVYTLFGPSSPTPDFTFEVLILANMQVLLPIQYHFKKPNGSRSRQEILIGGQWWEDTLKAPSPWAGLGAGLLLGLDYEGCVMCMLSSEALFQFCFVLFSYSGVELRALYLVGRCSSTWATPPAPIRAFHEKGRRFSRIRVLPLFLP
jgi:hypothetical protein